MTLAYPERHRPPRPRASCLRSRAFIRKAGLARFSDG